MIGIVIVAHGGLADEYKSALEHVVGVQQNLMAIGIGENHDRKSKQTEICNAVNDVDDGGTTDFDYYKVKIKPEVGKTLIWPAEWTHAHTGSVLKSGSKYIVTGWMHFTD